jgi:hypothetical protein
MSWIRRYASERTKLAQIEVAQAAKNLRRPAAKIDADTFSLVLIKSEIAEQHGAYFEPCFEHLDALVGLSRAMEPH